MRMRISLGKGQGVGEGGGGWGGRGCSKVALSIWCLGCVASFLPESPQVEGEGGFRQLGSKQWVSG